MKALWCNVKTGNVCCTEFPCQQWWASSLLCYGRILRCAPKYCVGWKSWLSATTNDPIYLWCSYEPIFAKIPSMALLFQPWLTIIRDAAMSDFAILDNRCNSWNWCNWRFTEIFRLISTKKTQFKVFFRGKF